MRAEISLFWKLNVKELELNQISGKSNQITNSDSEHTYYIAFCDKSSSLLKRINNYEVLPKWRTIK